MMMRSDENLMLTWVSLVHVSTFLRQGLESLLEQKLGISLAEQDLLKQLAVSDGPLRPSELADRLYFSRGGITKMLDKLERKKLLSRTPVAGDRRALQIALTSTGKKTWQKSRRLLHSFVDSEIGKHLSKAKQQELGTALRQLLQSHGRWQGQMDHLSGGAAGGK